MQSGDAKEFVLQLIKDVKRPVTGPVQLTIDEVSSLKAICEHVVQKLESGDKSRSLGAACNRLQRVVLHPVDGRAASHEQTPS